MRQEEAYAWLKVMIERKADKSDLTFTDHESPDYNPLKQMFKETPIFKGMPNENLMTVSIKVKESVTDVYVYLSLLYS